MELPSITIVTPCLNSRATLAETLGSVRSQQYPKLEHLVIDGGSTDGTLELLEAAEGVSYVSEPDRGLVDAVNKGFARASGELIGHLNADDFYLPGALLKVGEAFAAEPDALWVTGRCLIVDGQGHEIRRPITAYKNFFLRRYSFRMLLMQDFVSTPATFVARRGLEEVGHYDERFRYSADYDLWLRLARRADPLVIDEPLSAFRMVEGTLSMTGFEAQFLEHAQNAREHGGGEPLAVAANRAISRMIVLVYRLLGLIRARRA